jgi:hypothetical protein
MRRRGVVRFGLRLAVTAAVVGVLAGKLDWQRLAGALRGLNGGWWLAALGAYLLSQVVSAWRWAGLARGAGFDHSQGHFLRLYFEGVFFNVCLPTSIGGDVVKAIRLAGGAFGKLLAGCTVAADRMCGLTALGVLATAGAVGEALALGVWQTVLGAIMLGVAAVAAMRVALYLLGGLARRLRRPAGMAQLLKQLLVYRDRPRTIDRAIGLSFVVQLLVLAHVACLGRALHLDVPWRAYVIVVPLVSLATALPVSIGGAGLREGGLALLLVPYGATAESGAALGLVWFLVTAASALVGGAAYLAGRRPRAARCLEHQVQSADWAAKRAA